MNTIARMSTGVKVQESDRLQLHNLFDEATIERIARNTWSKLWSGFSWFGNLSAGVLGIYFFARSIKLIIDTTLHFLTLKSAFGWSMFLLCAFWDSLTHFVLYLGKKQPKPTPDTENPADETTTEIPRPAHTESPPPSTSSENTNPPSNPDYATLNHIYPDLPPRKKASE